MTTPSAGEIVDVVGRVGEALDAVGARYLVGGSVASSLLGEPRGTNDIDILVELRADQVDELTQQLGPDFEVDPDSLRDAIRRRRSWSVFFLPTVTKIDFFIKRDHPFDEMELSRRQRVRLTTSKEVYVATAEDMILRKLAWYRAGGESSTLQWRDVLGMYRLNSALDSGYLDGWAKELGVADLLERARAEARSGA